METEKPAPPEDDTASWIATGTFLDQLNNSVINLAAALDRNTAVAQTLDHRLVLLEEKEAQRALREQAAASRSFGAGVRDWSTHVGDWLYKQRNNKILLIGATAIAVAYVPEMKEVIVDLFKALTGK